MTSNEKLTDLISSAFGCDIMYYQEEYEEEIKMYLDIKNDLKLIDIIKNELHITLRSYKTNTGYLYFLRIGETNIFIPEEIYKQIKECL